jgi:hypothetical protein
MGSEPSNKFIYTEEDAKGCIMRSPDYSQCVDCMLNFEDEPLRCLAFQNPYKPGRIIHDKETCEHRRPITDETPEEKKERYEKMGDQMKLYGLHIPIDEL